MITLLVVDDQIMTRVGLRLRLSLEADITIVGEAGDGHEAIAMAMQLRPQVVLMDIKMPSMNGLEATKVLLTAVPETAVIITTMYATAVTKAQATAVGAAAFIPKQSDPKELLATIRRVAALIKNLDDQSEKKETKDV